MPFVSMFFGIIVRMFYSEHNPPHFHVRMSNGREASVDIITRETSHGSLLRREIRDALKWATDNRELLLAKFKEYNQ